MRALSLACVTVMLPTLANSQDSDGFDPIAIEWVLPGEFDVAWARAQEQKRLLVIKGVSFGIDEVGAVCATKGDW